MRIAKNITFWAIFTIQVMHNQVVVAGDKISGFEQAVIRAGNQARFDFQTGDLNCFFFNIFNGRPYLGLAGPVVAKDPALYFYIKQNRSDISELSRIFSTNAKAGVDAVVEQSVQAADGDVSKALKFLRKAKQYDKACLEAAYRLMAVISHWYDYVEKRNLFSNSKLFSDRSKSVKLIETIRDAYSQRSAVNEAVDNGYNYIDNRLISRGANGADFAPAIPEKSRLVKRDDGRKPPPAVRNLVPIKDRKIVKAHSRAVQLEKPAPNSLGNDPSVRKGSHSTDLPEKSDKELDALERALGKFL